MNKQKGMVILAATFLVVFLSIIFIVGNYFNYANLGATTENMLITKRDDNKNVMAGYSTKVREIAQAAKLGVDAQTKLIKLANESRYGENGSQATIQFLQEQNPTVDTQLYKQLQQVIEAERTRFTNAQTEMLDIRNQYKTMLDKPYSKFWLTFAGYPKINFSDFDIIINNYTENAYTTKRAEAIDLQ